MGCSYSADALCVSQPFLGIMEARLSASFGREAPLQVVSLCPRLALFLCRVIFPWPRSQWGWELEIQCWKYSASCTTNDFLRQTIRAAGSYRSPLPIPACSGGGTSPVVLLGHDHGLLLWHKHSLRAAYPQFLVGKGALP